MDEKQVTGYLARTLGGDYELPGLDYFELAELAKRLAARHNAIAEAAAAHFSVPVEEILARFADEAVRNGR